MMMKLIPAIVFLKLNIINDIQFCADFKNNRRLILLIMASVTDQKGIFSPPENNPIKYISNVLGIPVRSVEKYIKSLKDKGYIEKINRTTYKVNQSFMDSNRLNKNDVIHSNERGDKILEKIRDHIKPCYKIDHKKENDMLLEEIKSLKNNLNSMETDMKSMMEKIMNIVEGNVEPTIESKIKLVVDNSTKD